MGRTSWRSLARSPVLTLTIVGTLGVGIGAATALFTVVRGVLLEPLPYPDADRLVQLWETNPDVDDELHGPSPWNFVDWEEAAGSFDGMAAWFRTSGTYRTESWVEEIRSAQVTADFFRTLGVAPQIGRDFRPEEVQRFGPLMLSHRLWLRRFGGDPNVVGQSIIASGGSYEIVGVMPPGFAYPDESVEAWVAWNMPTSYEGNLEARTWRFLGGVARLADGTSMESAEAELDGIALRLADAWPTMNRGWGVEVTSLHEDTVGHARGSLLLAFGAVLFTLLIACANVANLLLTRLPDRLAEVRIRQALGASAGRIASEGIAEGLWLGLAGTVLGLVLASGLVELLVAVDAGSIPRLAELSLDAPVFAFAALLSFGASLACICLPLAISLFGGGGSLAGSATRVAGARWHGVARETFVGAQMAITLVLLAGAGLFALSFQRLSSVDPGLDVEGVAAFRVSLDAEEGNTARTVTYYDGLLDAVEAVPGVSMAGASQTLALNPIGNDFQRPYRPEGSELVSGDAPTVQMRIITRGYVETMGMRLREGTVLPEEAGLGDPLVALVNHTLAERLWPNGGAVGSHLEIDFREGWQPYRVTGVVEDVRHYGLRTPPVPEVFLSHAQVPYLAMNVVARTEGDPALLFEPLRAAVLGHVPMQPAHDFVSMEELLASSTSEEAFLALVLTLFSGLGLLLATTGVYGVLAFSVGQRRREIGVRMALGADPSGVARAVVLRALAISALGVGVGLLGVWTVRDVMGSLLYSVSATEPLPIAGVASLLVGVATLAAWAPARRAASVAPAEALRPE